MNKIELYKINEVFENKFYQIPQELFENKIYKDNLSLEAKMLYAFILDRLTLSKKNNWVNENGEIYLIFTRIEVQNKLNLSDKTVTKAFKQLKNIGLIHEKSQGFGKPRLIFVGKIKHENITLFEKIAVDNRKNYDTTNVKNTSNKSENIRPINTNNIKTDILNDIEDEILFGKNIKIID